MESSNEVNPHFLNHVIAAGEQRNIEASEDIYAGNGMKLLAKGARVDTSTRERLLEHKLKKPLEETVTISQAVSSQSLAQVAERMIEAHPILRALYTSAENPLKLIDGLVLPPQARSLLTVFGEHGPNKLEHAVVASLLAMGLAHKLESAATGKQRVLCVAGLMHDVGELYIDPSYLQRGAQLSPTQWKHVAAHPVIANRLLKDMPQLGLPVSTAILTHHERLDGFGYPRGLRADQIPIESQLLAVSEILCGLLEISATPVQHAEVALKLVPGEFNRKIIDAVAALTRQCEGKETGAVTMPAIEDTRLDLERITHTVAAIEAFKVPLAEEMGKAPAAYKVLLDSTIARIDAICRALSSTGLDPAGYMTLLDGLERDPVMQLEVVLIVREIRWRLRELQRELKLRLESVNPKDLAMLRQIVDQLSAEPQAPVAPSAVPA